MNLSLDAFLLLKENLPNDLIRVIFNILIDPNLHIDALELTIKNIFEKLKSRNGHYKNITCEFSRKIIYYYEQGKRGLNTHYRICVNINHDDYWSYYRRDLKQQLQKIISQNEYIIIYNMTSYKYCSFDVDLYIRDGKFLHSSERIRKRSKLKYIKYKENNKWQDYSLYQYPILQ